MPKSTKRFILSTSQLNSHKFRCLTDGADLEDFKANPIMYWLHITPDGSSKEELLPIGFWEDIQVEGDEITAVPNFDDSDEFAMKIYKKVEHGTLRAASVECDPVQLDTNKANWLPGQKLPTFKKWKIGEASIVDRGSNKGAIVKLKHRGKVITLSDQASAVEFFENLQKSDEVNMKIKLNQKAAKALKLSVDSEMDATEVVDKLVEVIEGNENALKQKDDKVTELEGTVTTLKDAAESEKITLMVDKAITDRKILAGNKEKYIKLAKGDFATTKELLDGMKSSESLESTIVDDSAEGEVAKLMKLSFDDLHQGPGLAKLKQLNPAGYKLKFKEKFGKDPQ